MYMHKYMYLFILHMTYLHIIRSNTTVLEYSVLSSVCVVYSLHSMHKYLREVCTLYHTTTTCTGTRVSDISYLYSGVQVLQTPVLLCCTMVYHVYDTMIYQVLQYDTRYSMHMHSSRGISYYDTTQLMFSEYIMTYVHTHNLSVELYA